MEHRFGNAVRSFAVILASGLLQASSAGLVAAASVEAGTFTAPPGEQVTVVVTLHTEGALVAAVQADVGFAPEVPIAAKANGKADCTVNPDIDKNAGTFTFHPIGCGASACTGVRALVLSLTDVAPILDGSVLYTCHAQVSPTAPEAIYPLSISNVILSDPNGTEIVPASGVDGAIIVSGTKLPSTPTPTPTSTPTSTRTPTPTPSPVECTGDCDGSGDVTITELITLVNLALGNAASACTAGDADGNGDITVDEIIKAVGFALTNCPASSRAQQTHDLVSGPGFRVPGSGKTQENS